MKQLIRYIDLWMQLVLFVVVIISMLINENVWFWALMGQFAIGMYQLTSAAFHTVSRTYRYPLNLRMNHYWLGVIFYGITATILYNLAPEKAFLWFFALGGWFLATYFFGLTLVHDLKR